MRGLPLSPDFAEVDCLTYVTYGGEPGIWFFRIDAATGFGSVMARTFFGLPYNHSAVSLGQEGDDRTLDCEGKAGRVDHARSCGSGTGHEERRARRHRERWSISWSSVW